MSSRADSRTRRGRRLLTLFVVLFLVVAAGAGGYYLLSRSQATPGGAEQARFAPVQRGDIEDLVTATGTLQPRDYVDVGAQVSGQLKKIHVEIGSEVKAGDLLAEIDPTVFRAKVDGNRAQLLNQRAQLEDRKAQLKLAQLNFNRQKNLLKENATTEEAYQSAEANLQSTLAQIDVIKAQIQQTESTLRADEASLSYTNIYAPMTGTVVSITARQGQTLNANQQAPIILRIADLSVMTVQTQVSEADVGRLRLGMDAYFTTLGSQTRRWEGQLRKIEPTPTVQNNVVLYNALFDVPNPNQTLMTQMTAQVFFIVASAKDALLIPVSAVTPVSAPNGAARAPSSTAPESGERRPGGRGLRKGTVKLRMADGAVVERTVTLGVGNRIQVQVLEGVSEGEQVQLNTRPNNARPGGNNRSGMPPMPPRI